MDPGTSSGSKATRLIGFPHVRFSVCSQCPQMALPRLLAVTAAANSRWRLVCYRIESYLRSEVSCQISLAHKAGLCCQPTGLLEPDSGIKTYNL